MRWQHRKDCWSVLTSWKKEKFSGLKDCQIGLDRGSKNDECGTKNETIYAILFDWVLTESWQQWDMIKLKHKGPSVERQVLPRQILSHLHIMRSRFDVFIEFICTQTFERRKTEHWLINRLYRKKVFEYYFPQNRILLLNDRFSSKS